MSIRTRKIIHIVFYVIFAALIGFGGYLFIHSFFRHNKLVELNAKYITLYEGDAYPLQGEYMLEDGTLAKIIYSINNEKVATIDRDTGVVIAKKSGKATLFATVDGDSSIYSEASIKVIKQSKSEDKIIVNDKKINLVVNDQRNTHISIGKTAPSRVKYHTQNPNVAVVDENGVIKATGDGSTKIEVSVDDNKPEVIDIDVKPTPKIDVKPTPKDENEKIDNPKVDLGNPNQEGTTTPKNPTSYNVTSVALNKSYLNLITGQSEKLNAAIFPVHAKNRKVGWTTSNKNVATVDSNGNVKAVGAGSAIITVVTADGNKTAICKVTVTAPVKTHINKIHFLDTQSQTHPYFHNDAILLESNGKFAMVDTGVGDDSCPRILNYLNSVGVKKLDFVVITHWHNDHYGCWATFNDGKDIETDKYYAKNIDATYHVSLPVPYQAEYERFKQSAASKLSLLKDNINIDFEDYTLELKNMTNRVQILMNENLCNGAHADCSENTNSIVIKGTDKMSGKTFYLAGDMEGYRDKNGSVLHDWEIEFARAIGNVDIYKVAHHGHGSSKLTYNNPRQTMDLLKPKYSIITSGRTSDNATGIKDTTQYLMDVGSKVYFSGCGTVIATFPKNASGNIDVVQLANIDTTAKDSCISFGTGMIPQP